MAVDIWFPALFLLVWTANIVTRPHGKYNPLVVKRFDKRWLCTEYVMLEETHFAEDPPDTELVYELRRAASTGTAFGELLDLIVDRGHGGGFGFAVYFVMSFGVPIRLMKEFAGYVSEETSNIELASLEIVGQILRAIEDNRETWENRLKP